MLALFTTVAIGGRREGLRFFGGEIAGDVFWSTLALAAILGVSSIGPRISAGLGLCCGLYLVSMGWRALTWKADGRARPAQSTNSLRTGLILVSPIRSLIPCSLLFLGPSSANLERN